MLCSPKFPPLEKGRKTHQKSAPTSQKKKKKTPDLTRRGKSNVLAHGPIIRVLTVGYLAAALGIRVCSAHHNIEVKHQRAFLYHHSNHARYPLLTSCDLSHSGRGPVVRLDSYLAIASSLYFQGISFDFNFEYCDQFITFIYFSSLSIFIRTLPFDQYG